MNVNGGRFHLLLGAADWGRCRVAAADSWRALADWWQEAETPADAATATLEPAPLSFDASRGELRLAFRVPTLPATPGETPFTLADRRAAAADRNGNIYWVSSDRGRLLVHSVGSGRAADFWPDASQGPDYRRLFRTTCAVAAAAPATRFLALAVTEDHHLVAAVRDADGSGLLAFDLVGGGPPLRLGWSPGITIAPFALAPRAGGGLWLLDRTAARLWELDRRLQPVRGATAPEPSSRPTLFQPPAGPERRRPAPTAAAGIDLRDPLLTVPGTEPVMPITDPIAVVPQAPDVLLILDRADDSGPSRVYRLRRHDGQWQLDPPVALPVTAHDMILAEPRMREGTGLRLLVGTTDGNQALAFAVGPPAATFRLHGAVELYPLRRHGGRALLRVQGQAWYDTGGDPAHWVPVVEQRRLGAVEGAELITPVLDGGTPQCTWDRLLLDGCIGADTRVEVWGRAADQCWSPSTPGVEPGACTAAPDGEPLAPWLPQPGPRLRGDGPELPWLRAEARHPSIPGAGSGTWELLLQGQRGRWLQLRLRLAGNGGTSPRLRALRVWYPRFSYPRRFLPAVYREDPTDADFLERFLANMEQVNTRIEDRIATVQALLSPASAPAEALDWLADWLDLALDPAWDQRRRRLLIANALAFFRWRGTSHGLRMALALAFEPCIDPALFAEPDGERGARARTGVRIVEAYQARVLGGLAAGDPDRPGGDIGLPAAIKPGSRWTLQEGNAGLVQRYARAVLQRDATPAEQIAPFALFPPVDHAATGAEQAARRQAWEAFCRATLGFVPAAGAAERYRWQCWLATRFSSTATLAEALSLDPELDAAALQRHIDLPADWPPPAGVVEHWRAYCAQTEPTRQHWQQTLARRWRRIEALNETWRTQWPSFALIPLPDYLPASGAAQADWLRFEGRILPIKATAHRFSVLLPVTGTSGDPAALTRRLALARRITELEKPAHTIFDVRLYWSMNRIGAARLGLDTLLDAGSRAESLIPDAVLGQAYLGAAFIAGARAATDPTRRRLSC